MKSILSSIQPRDAAISARRCCGVAARYQETEGAIAEAGGRIAMEDSTRPTRLVNSAYDLQHIGPAAGVEAVTRYESLQSSIEQLGHQRP